MDITKRYQSVSFDDKLSVLFDLNNKDKSTKENLSNITCSLLDKIISLRISKNHAGEWGVLVGSNSCLFRYRHEDKEQVLKWVKENFNALFDEQNK